MMGRVAGRLMLAGLLFGSSEAIAAADGEPAAFVPERRHLMVVRGADGEASFRERFDEMARQWREAAQAAGDVDFVLAKDREGIEQGLAQFPAWAEVWLVMVGHGTFNGREAKFNLEGEDLEADELAGWLDGREGPTVVINCAQASAPFIPALKREGRVVVTATKSGNEVDLTYFGVYLAEVLQDPVADLNKDGQNSILECFLLAAKRTAQHYEEQGRIATEHALLDDSGDGLGTRAEWFDGLRLVRKGEGEDSKDGEWARRLHLVPGPLDRMLTAAERRRRDELERQVEAIRERRDELGEERFYAEVEALFVELAELYEQAEARE